MSNLDDDLFLLPTPPSAVSQVATLLAWLALAAGAVLAGRALWRRVHG